MVVRRHLLIGGLLTAAGASALSQQVMTGPQMALLIGNSDYKFGALKNPPNDVAVMAVALEGVGYAVTRAQNLSDRQFRLLIENFARQAAANRALGLIYLSGHGLALRGSVRYLGLSDEPVSDVDSLLRNSSALSWILAVMQDYRRSTSLNTPIVLIADIASDQMTFQDPNVKPFPPETLAVDLAVIPHSLVWLASTPGTIAFDEENGKNGLMTKHLVNALQGGGLTLEQLVTRVRSQVQTESKMRQTPWSSMASSLERVVFNTTNQNTPRPSLADDPKVFGRGARGG